MAENLKHGHKHSK